MKILKYIGPFLRLNNLSKEMIESQLFYFAKESTKHIVLNSKFGINIPFKELKIKTSSNFDINTFKESSPLLCIYKRSNTKLLTHKNNVFWDEDSFKKEVNISSNGYLTLCLLELANYYEKFKDLDKELYGLYHIYINLVKHQLNFYSSYLRNEEGLFVDKKDISDPITKELNFETKNKKFKYSNQILMMNCYAIYSIISKTEDSDEYYTFSKDILNMVLRYKDEIYSLSLHEKINILSLLNIYLKFDNNNDILLLTIDIMDLIHDELQNLNNSTSISNTSLIFITSILFKHTTGISKYENFSDDIYKELINLCDEERFVLSKKNSSKKDIDYNSYEICFYILSLIYKNKFSDDKESNAKFEYIYRKHILNSGIVCSWPEPPNINSIERYNNHTLKSEDLIDEIYFKLPTLPTPETSGLAPVIIKDIKYNVKKDEFTINKQVFDSTKYFQYLLYMIYLSSN